MYIRNCVVEIDEERGVIYVHSPERTIIRICRMKLRGAIKEEGEFFIDITAPELVSIVGG